MKNSTLKNGLVALRSAAIALSATAALVATAANATPAVYGESASVKVRPNAQVKTNDSVTLAGARNEFVSFQVVVNGGTAGATNVSASFGGVSGDGGTIGGDDLTLYREELINISQPSAPDAAGQWPDGLVPDVDEIAHEKRNAFPFNVSANQSRAIWVDLHVPAAAQPGTYQGEVKVTADGFSQSIPVTLNVLAATLPSTSSVASAFLIFDGNVCRAHTGSSDCGGAARRNQLIEEYERLALDHRFTLSNVPYFPKNGDFTDYDTQWGPFLDGTADTRLQGAEMTSLQYTGPQSASSYASFDQHLQQKGWLARSYDYTADEPPYGTPWSSIPSRAQLVHQNAPGLSTLVTTTIGEAQAAGVAADIDTMVPVVNFIDGNSSPYQGDQRSSYDSWLQDSKKKLWLYQSCMSHGCAYGTNANGSSADKGWPSYMIDTSAGRNRAMQWVDFAEKASGELYYETANMLPSAWSNQFSFGGNGDGTLFYPGTVAKIGGKTEVPVPSIRMKYLRMGMQDYEWLRLVAQAGDPTFAQAEARKVVPSASQVSSDGTLYDQVRAELEQRYSELTGGNDPAPADPSNPGAPSPPPSDTGGTPMAGNLTPDKSVKPLVGGCSATPAGLAPMALVALALALLSRRRRPAPVEVRKDEKAGK